MNNSTRSTSSENTTANYPADKKISQPPKKRVKGDSDEGIDHDWQAEMNVLNERFDYVFQNGLYSDVSFIVSSGTETEKIPAHKLVLAAGSVVFHTMFTEKWSADCSEIEVEDVVKPSIFKELLKFLYTDKVNPTADTVMDIMYVAKKYAVRALENRCGAFLVTQLNPSNAFTILIQARFFEVEKLTVACINMIADNTKDTLQTEDFLNIDAETLCLVLKCSDLRIDEMELFKAVIRWTEAACMKQKLPINPQNQRKVLKDAVSFLRFPLMNPQEFATTVVNSGILTKSESLSVLVYFNAKAESCVGFSNIPRGVLSTLKRFTHENSLLYHYGYPHNLMFQSDHKIQLAGIGLYGSSSQSTQYTATVIVKDSTSGAILIQESAASDRSSKIIRILFKKSVNLFANTKYKFEISFQGNYSFYGMGGKGTIKMDLAPGRQISFSFYNVDPEGNYPQGTKTYVSNGQIPEILFYS